MPSADVLALTGLTQLTRWNVAAPVGTSVVVTYSFPTTQAPYDGTARPSFSGLSATQQDYARQALTTWGNATGISFIEVPSSVGGQIRFGLYDMSGVLNSVGQQASGFAFYPQYSATSSGGPIIYDTYFGGIGGDIFMNANFYAGNDFAMSPGQRGYSIMLHEIGHALGFKHPFEGSPTIDPAHDSGYYTVMSYTRPNSTTTLGIVDTEALLYYYGADDLTNSWNAATLTLTRTGTASGEWILGTELTDNLLGLDGGDTLMGALGADTLDGGLGADSLSGGDGGDRMVAATSDGNDTLTGGAGFDVLDFSAVGGVVQVNQFAGTVTGSAGNDTLTDIFEQVIGTAFGDVLAGGNGINVLDGNGGADLFFGNGGQDLMRGGDGNDTFYGQTADGNDTIEGGAGFDLIDFGTAGGVIQLNMFTNSSTGTAGNDTFSGIEYVIGSNFGDVIAGSNGVNAFEGGGGADQLFGNGGIDWMRGGTGNDTATLGTGNDTWYFANGDGVDTINDFVAGGTDDDIDLTTAATGYASFAAMQTFVGAIVQSGADTFLNLDPGGGSTDRIILKNVTATNLTAADFVF